MIFISPRRRMRARSGVRRRISRYRRICERPFLHPRTVHPKGKSLAAPLLLSAVVISGACSKGSSDEANAATRPPAGAPVAGPGGAAGGAAGGAGAAGHGAQTLTLAPTDVSVAQPTTMVEGVAITGNLRPIETVSV